MTTEVAWVWEWERLGIELRAMEAERDALVVSALASSSLRAVAGLIGCSHPMVAKIAARARKREAARLALRPRIYHGSNVARWLNVKRPGPCFACGARLAEGDRAWWDPEHRSLTCPAEYCRATGGIPLDSLGMMNP